MGPEAIAGWPRLYIQSMCRPNAAKATTMPTATAADRGAPAAFSKRAVPAPIKMLVTAAIMLAPVNSISIALARMPVLASAAAASVPSADAKNAAAAGSSVA